MKTQLKNVRYGQRFRLSAAGNILQILGIQKPGARENGTVKVLIGNSPTSCMWKDWNTQVEIVDDLTPAEEVSQEVAEVE